MVTIAVLGGVAGVAVLVGAASALGVNPLAVAWWAGSLIGQLLTGLTD